MKHLLCALLFFATYAHATTYYIAANGNSTNNGTSQSTPWSLDKLNASWSVILPGDQILLQKGDVFNSGIVVGKSGTASAPITIGYYGTATAKPLLNALVPVSGWVSKGNGIYESTTTTPVDLMMVLINNKVTGQGRTPNAGSYYLSSGGGTSSSTGTNMPTTTNWTGATLGTRVSHWQIARYPITGQSGSTITFSNGRYLAGGYGLWIMNDIRTLDQFGEWYRNPTTGKLSMFFGAESPASYKVEMSTVDILLLSTSHSYITVQGLAIKGSNNNAIDINYGTDITISDCDIDASGSSGIDTKDHTNLTVTANRVTRSLNNGLHLNMYSTGDNIKATNNYIDSSYFIEGMGGSGQQDGNGITLGRAGLVEGNIVKHSGYCGVRFSAYLCTIKNNFIDTFCFVKDDGGGIYTGGNNPWKSTPKKTLIGNVILHSSGAAKGTPDVDNRGEGIYTDDDANHVDIIGNTVAYVDRGLYIHNNTDMVINANTFFSNIQNMYYRHDADTGITNIRSTKNIVFSLTTAQRLVYAGNIVKKGVTSHMGIIDSNYYCRPIDEGLTSPGKALDWRDSSTEVAVTFAGWQSKYRNIYDQASQKTAKTITSASEVRFEYNPTGSPTDISLNGKKYIDPTGVPYTSGTLTLAPYASKILLYTGVISGTAPTVSVATNATQYNAPATVNITANASDDGSITKVDFYSGSTLLFSDNTAPYAYSWTNVTAGNYNITAKATDNTGLSTTSSTAAIAVNGVTAPSVALTSPANNSTYSAPATVNITASASDADGTVSKVDFYNGATLIGTDATSPYTFTWSNVAAGNYSITAKATDNSNLVTTSGAISITVSATGNTAPTVALNQPIGGTQYSSPATISIAATASDVDGIVQRVEFYAGSTLLNIDSVAPYAYTWTNVAVGNYSITAKAFDNLGASKTSAISTVTVVAPPSYPTVSLTSPINNATFTTPATIDLTATASDANGIASVKFYSDSTLLYTVTTAPYTKSWANVASGTYHITAVATDSTGLSTTSAARTITVQPVNNSVGVISGELKKWHKTTVTFDGPTTSETSTPNPSLDYRLNVTFRHSSGETFVVPGYFAADGNAAETGATSGNKWRVHFSPDQTGVWTYTASFRQGTNIAINDTVNVGTPVSSIDGATGTFTISANDKTGIDLRAKGRLNYVGSHLLQWAETKTYWRKNGTDAPENLLAYADIDNVSNYKSYIKTYSPHVADWKTGDPVWQSTKGKGLIGAINYLSSVGENSISFLTMNIRGDDRNVWPFIDTTQRTRMDVSKLDQWGIIFDHAESKGMHLHFKTQEVESWPVLGGDMTIQRKLYYRTLIARYAYHLALNWNLGEENTQTTQQQKDMASYFATHDPYHSNIVLHSYPTEQELHYRPLLGTASNLTGVSIQKDTALGYAEVRKWVEASAASGKKWVVAWDEQGSAAVGVAADGNYTGNRGTVADNSDMIRRSVLWGTYMAGGDGVEYYYGYNTGETDLTLQDFRSRAKSYGYAKIAREFFDNYFPTTELKPLSNVSSTTAWSLGKDSFAYVVYLRYGGTTNITMPAGNYSVTWFNPRTGGATVNGSVTTITSTGTAKAIGNPPNTANADWVALIQKFTTTGNPPTVTLTSPANNSKYVVGDTIVLTATASGQNPIASVKFYSGTTLLFTETTAPYTRNWIGVAAGVYNITAVATDNAGLTSTTPISVVTVQATSVNKAPTVAITAPVNNAQFTAPATINITATASDVDGTVKKVEFFNGSTLLATDTTSPYSYSWANAGVGNYNISARATDNSGNQTSSTPVAVTVGTAPVPPTVSLISPINNSTYTATASITLTANATDGDGTIASVKFYNGTTLLATVTTAPYTINWSNVAVGTYTFTAVATDNSGMSTTSGGVSVTVKSAPVNQPPTINLTAPATGGIYTSPATINIAATAADADGTVSKVDFYNGNTLLFSDASSPYSYTWSGVGTGTYNITAKATDNSGAVTASTTSTVSVNAPPVAPSVSLTDPANNTVYTSPATVNIAATASDPDGTVTKVDFYNGSTLLSSDASAPYGFTWSGVSAGNYTITAKATDNTGLTTTSGAISVTVNSPVNVPPSASMTSPANNSTFTQPTSLTIAVNATDADGSVTKVDFYNGATF